MTTKQQRRKNQSKLSWKKIVDKNSNNNLVSFIAKEVDFLKVFKIPQAICLVPTLRKDLYLIISMVEIDISRAVDLFTMIMLKLNFTYIKAYLPSYGECQIQMCKFLPKDRNHFGAYILDLNVDYKIYLNSCPQNKNAS